jgi:hypothetical protein
MKLGILLLIVLSFSALAQREPRNECHRPGEVLERRYLGLVSESQSNVVSHKGKDLVGTANASFENSYEIFKRYEVVRCEQKTFYREVTRCTPVDLDTALGRGNRVFKELFDTYLSTLERGKLLNENLTYLRDMYKDDRFEISINLAKFYLKYTAEKSIPKSWNTFIEMNRKALDRSIISQEAFMDISKNYIEENKEVFGFSVPDDVKIIEGKGNENLSDLFDLSLSLTTRANIIKRQIKGISNTDYTRRLARELVILASDNGAPRSWAEFSLFIKEASERDVISKAMYKHIITEFEEQNREFLGFTVKAQRCTRVRVPYQVNQIETHFSKRSYKTVQASFEVSINNAPLMASEAQSFRIEFDGLAKIPKVSVNSKYNRFAVAKIVNHLGDRFSIEFNGVERVKVNPFNTVSAKLVKTATGKYSVKFTDKFFDQDYQEKTIVHVTVYRSKFLSRERLKSFTVDLSNTSSITNFDFIQTVYKNKKVYLEYSISRSDSAYFNTSQSRTDRSNKN